MGRVPICIDVDDAALAAQLGAYLGDRGHPVQAAATAAMAASAAPALSPSGDSAVVLFGRLLAPERALPLLGRWRARSDAPLMALCPALAVGLRVALLDAGADDALALPVEPRELAARIKAVLRRPHSIAPQAGAALMFDGFRLLAGERRLQRPDGAQVALSGTETLLLRALAQQPHRALGRDELARIVVGDHANIGPRAMDLLVSRVRAKLGGSGDALIRTVRGRGYRFDPRDAGRPALSGDRWPQGDLQG